MAADGVLGGDKYTESAPVTFLFEGEGVPIVFDTLTQMMKTSVACFEEGVFPEVARSLAWLGAEVILLRAASDGYIKMLSDIVAWRY